MLASSEENDRTLGCSDSTERTTTLSMAIKLGDDDRTNGDSFFEGLGLSETSLSDTTVHDEDTSVWLNLLLNLDHLIEKCGLLSMPTRGINNDNFILILSEVSYTSFSNFNRISLLLVTIEGALNFRGIHLKLSEGTGTEGICADDSNLPPLLHVMIGELGTSRGFTRTLKTDKHDNIGLATLELICLV